ncbi:MAG: hypothetical protein ACT4RN_15615 [Pseudonocardia sp.]
MARFRLFGRAAPTGAYPPGGAHPRGTAHATGGAYPTRTAYPTGDGWPGAHLPPPGRYPGVADLDTPTVQHAAAPHPPGGPGLLDPAAAWPTWGGAAVVRADPTTPVPGPREAVAAAATWPPAPRPRPGAPVPAPSGPAAQHVPGPSAQHVAGPAAQHVSGPAAQHVPAAVPQPDAAEAGALAGAFAVDYLSWDEDDPARRGRVLRDYLRPPAGDPALLGWSGTGRQRGEFALPGLVRPDGDGRVLVDVRVRVTPYRAVGERTPEPPTPPEIASGLAGVPAVAPAPTGRGWRSLASCWVRLSVPVTREGGRLVVDAWEETLSLDTPAPSPTRAAAPADHALVDDDPLVGGAA